MRELVTNELDHVSGGDIIGLNTYLADTRYKTMAAIISSELETFTSWGMELTALGNGQYTATYYGYGFFDIDNDNILDSNETYLTDANGYVVDFDGSNNPLEDERFTLTPAIQNMLNSWKPLTS